MILTNNPCHYCEKRTPDCRISCGRYKVYHTAKMKQYEKQRKEREAEAAVMEHFSRSIERVRKRLVKMTPIKNGALKKKR